MSEFWEDIYKRLEKDKKNYKFIFYNQKKNELFLAKELYRLLPRKTLWLRGYDGKLWGTDKKFNDDFKYICKL